MVNSRSRLAKAGDDAGGIAKKRDGRSSRRRGRLEIPSPAVTRAAALALQEPSPAMTVLEPMLAAAGEGSSSADPLDLRYPGGKGVAGLAAWICSLLPAHVYYAEPFAGKGSVLRAKLPALRSTLVDRDDEVLAWWRKLSTPGATVEGGDGIRYCELAAEWGPPDLLLYCDPPYLPETRTHKRLYRHELSYADHDRLLAALVRCRCSVAISGYASKLYDQRLAGWRRSTRWVITRGAVLREEVLWTNGQAADAAISRSYGSLGADFRQRERVKRKADRWASRIMAMPAAERQAVYLQLVDAMRGRVPHRRSRR